MKQLNVKSHGSTVEVHLKPFILSTVEGDGIPGVGVKSVDIRRNTSGEGDLLGRY